MAGSLTTRRLSADDVPAALEVMRLALGESQILQRTPELFAWKHFDNPFGESISLVAESDGSMAGLRTFMRWDLDTASGERVRCVRAVDTATHPDYRRQGIFRRLTEEAIEIAREEGIDLVFNTPNEQSKQGYLSMGWVDVGPIGAMVRPSWRMVRIGGSSATSFEEPIHPIQEDSEIDVTNRQPLGLRTPRTRSYIQWRFGSHPRARYGTVADEDGRAIVRSNSRKGRPELVIADLFGRAGRALRTALKSTNADYAASWFAKGTPERAVAMRAGLIPLPGVKALNLVARPLRELSVDVSRLESWDTAVSDFELL